MDSNEVPVQDEVDIVDIKELVKGAQNGDTDSFEDIYQVFFPRIYRYILFKVGDVADAEDLTEDVFVKVLESIGSFRWKGHPFSSWLFRIAHNLVVDRLRKRSRQPTEPLENIVEPSHYNLDHQVELRLTIDEVNEAMKSLTQAQRDVITLRLGTGLSLAETAKVVGKKENAVKALQHAGLLKLRRLMTSTAKETLPNESYRVIPGTEG